MLEEHPLGQLVVWGAKGPPWHLAPGMRAMSRMAPHTGSCCGAGRCVGRTWGPIHPCLALSTSSQGMGCEGYEKSD